jgi:carbon storage regulator
MLVLTRKSGEAIQIGDNITITVVEIKGNQVRLGIDAPSDVLIYRKELYERIREENLISARVSIDDFRSIKERIRPDDKV